MLQELFTINMNALQMSDDELFEFCQDNENLHIERNEQKQIILMSPTGFLSGFYNSEINYQLKIWNAQYQNGLVSDSSTGYLLPDDSMRSPDAAWISKSLWATVPADKKHKFPPICPEFIIELRSHSDTLDHLKRKMTDTWIKNGTKLAWLIDPQQQQSSIYRENGSIEIIEGFQTKLSGENVLPNFELDLSKLKEV